MLLHQGLFSVICINYFNSNVYVLYQFANNFLSVLIRFIMTMKSSIGTARYNKTAFFIFYETSQEIGE